MRHRFAVFFVIECVDERSRDEALAVLRQTNGVFAHPAPPSKPGGLLFVWSTVRASSGKAACDRLQQRLRVDGSLPSNARLARRGADRMRYQGGLRWHTSTLAELSGHDVATIARVLGVSGGSGTEPYGWTAMTC